MAIAGAVNLIFKANTTGATSGLKKLQKETSRTEKAFSSMRSGVGSFVGALNPFTLSVAGVGAAISAYAGNVMQARKETAEWADRLAVSTKQFDGIAKFAKRFGGSIDDVGDSMKDLNERIADAAGGNKTYEEALNKIGLKSKELIDLPVAEQFTKVAGAIGKLNNVGDQNFVTAELMADAGFRLLPMFREGEGAINSYVEQLSEANGLMDDTAVNKMKLMTQIGADLSTVFEGMAISVGGFMDQFLSFSKNDSLLQDWADFARWISGGADWRKQLEQSREEGFQISLSAGDQQRDAEEAAQREQSKKINEYWTKQNKRAEDDWALQQQFREMYEQERLFNEQKLQSEKMKEVQGRIDELKEEMMGATSSVMKSFTAQQFDPNRIRLGGAGQERAQRQYQAMLDQIEETKKSKLELTKQTRLLNDIKLQQGFSGSIGSGGAA